MRDRPMHSKGWYSRGYLPHFDSPETIQFITFRLADSLPKAVAQALAELPDNLAQTDNELDTGLGACWLGRADIAEIVQATLLHFDSERYRLLAWCIMPNHVHAVVEPHGNQAIDRIFQSWKSYSAHRATNCLAGRGFSGTATTSTVSCATKAISVGRSDMSRTIP